jgi:CRP-like cAMP-binding protein
MKVKEILNSVLLAHEQVLVVPKPLVRTVKFADSAIEYEMLFFLEDFGCSPGVKDDLLTRIWYEFKKHGVQIPFPTRTVQLKDGPQLAAEKEVLSRQQGRVVTFLQSLPQFSRYLQPGDFEFLALNATESESAPAELIIRKGTTGDSIFIVQSGWCEVTLPEGLQKRLMPGEYFGEMAMLTGQPRSADIRAGARGASLVCLGRESLLTILAKYPRMQDEFDQTREARLEETRARNAQTLDQKPSLGRKIGKVFREHFVPW